MISSTQLRALFSSFRENALNGPHVALEDISPLIEKLKDYSECTVDLLGYSAEQRPIHLIRWGHGPKKVMMWSQMHGDEPTATRAIFDLLNFLLKHWQHELPYLLEESLTLYFIPLLNPDGAAINWRYNAWGIDLNRDAKALQTPEARLLSHLADAIIPHYGFNLHDQYSYYSAGIHPLPASISFLANPVDDFGGIPAHRREAMQLIAHINPRLQEAMPGQVGRYVSDFDPTSFGDTFQTRGICTMLVEAGGGGDDERSQAREFIFMALLSALEAIATGAHQQEDPARYGLIPENRLRLYDVILRNVCLPTGKEPIKADVGINLQREWDGKGWIRKAFVINFGDLSGYNGLKELDGKEQLLAFMPQRGMSGEEVLRDFGLLPQNPVL